jgi:arsenate reductase
MAEGWLRYFYSSKIDVYSAGLEAHGINPYMKKVMESHNLNIDSHTSNQMKEYSHLSFDLVITVCDHAKNNCPYFKNTESIIHQSFLDPADAKGSDEEKLVVYSKVCEEIKQFCSELVF